MIIGILIVRAIQQKRIYLAKTWRHYNQHNPTQEITPALLIWHHLYKYYHDKVMLTTFIQPLSRSQFRLMNPFSAEQTYDKE